MSIQEKAFNTGRDTKTHLLPCEVHCTRNADDKKANDDGSDGHPLGIPPQSLGSFVVSIIVAVQRLGDTREELMTTDNP